MHRNSNKKSANVTASFRNQKEGFLEKKTGFLSMWRNRYFVLMHDVLCYFKNEDEKESMTPAGRVFFNDITSIDRVEKRGRPFCFIITEEEKKHLISCSSESERNSWIEAIEKGKDRHSNQEKFDPVRRKSARIGKDLKRVTIQKDAGGGIGCTIKNVGGAIFVNRIIPDGPVAVSGVLRPGDQIVDINGIKISGSPIEKIKEVIRQSPEYVVCTVKPVTHYASSDSPPLSSTPYTEIDTEFLNSKPLDLESKSSSNKNDSHLNYANIEVCHGQQKEEGIDYDKQANANYVNLSDKGTAQNYAELDFSRH